MLAIRFNRTGKRNQASFRVVLQDKRKAPGRRHVEILGSWNPHTKEAILKSERILHWIGEGAEVSDSVHNLLVKQKVIEGKSRVIKMPKPAVKEAASTVEQAVSDAGKKAVAETPVVEVVAVEETPIVEAAVEETVVEEAPKVEAVGTEVLKEEVEAAVAEVPAAKAETPAKA